HPHESTLAAYALQELDGGRARAVLGHLFECDGDCLALVWSYHTITSDPEPQLALALDDLPTRRAAQPVRLAAAPPGHEATPRGPLLSPRVTDGGATVVVALGAGGLRVGLPADAAAAPALELNCLGAEERTLELTLEPAAPPDVGELRDLRWWRVTGK